MSYSKCPSDHTLLQIGTLVHHQEQSFEVVGRVQFLYSAGFWNEWHLLDQQKESWWLGEAMEQFFLFQENLEIPTPSRTTLKLGESTLVGQEDCALFSVAPMEVAKTEGELPFHPPVGFKYLCYDLRSKGKLGFFLKYKELRNEINTLYQGQWLNFDELKFENTREADPNSLSPPQFKCQQCDTPIQLYLGNASHTYYCPGCGTPYDTSSLEPKLLSQTPKSEKVCTPIVLGDRFTHQETSWRCVAIFHKESLLEKALLEVESAWDREPQKTSIKIKKEKFFERDPEFFEEYLLFHPHKGYRSLLSLQHRWIWLEPTLKTPDPHPVKIDAGDLKVAQLKISHPLNPNQLHYFFSEKITIKNALGEIPLGESIGQTTRAHHFINPPQMLRLKQDLEQLSWSVGTHLSHQELQEQFPDRSFPLPSESTPPSPCQPNPHLEKDKKSFRLFLCFFIPFLLIALYQIFSTEKIHDFSHSIPLLQDSQNEKDFHFPQRGSMDLRFMASGLTSGDRNIKAIFTHQETQTSYQLKPFLKQGNLHKLRLRGMPKGHYTLTWSGSDPKGFAQKATPIVLSTEISKSSFTYLAFLLSLIATLPFLFGLFYTSNNFELFRWKDKTIEECQTSRQSYLLLTMWVAPIFLSAISVYYFSIYNIVEHEGIIVASIFSSLALYPIFIYLAFKGLIFQTNQKTFPFLLIILALFACNSFFGYGCSSEHTKLQASSIKEPLMAEPHHEKAMTTIPDGDRAL